MDEAAIADAERSDQQEQGRTLTCKCGRTMPAPAGCTERTDFTCRVCAATPGAAPESNQERAFDHWQFYTPRRSPKFLHQLANHVDTDIDQPDKFQEIPPPRPRHDAPQWAFNDLFLLRLAARHSRNLDQTARRVSILYYYFRCGWAAKEIAGEIGTTTTAVESAIARAAERAICEWPAFAAGDVPENGRDGFRALKAALRIAKRGTKARTLERAARLERFHARTITQQVIDLLADESFDTNGKTYSFVKCYGEAKALGDLLARLKRETGDRDEIGEAVVRSLAPQENKPRRKPGRRRRDRPSDGFEYRNSRDWLESFDEAKCGLSELTGSYNPDADSCAEEP